MATVTIAFSSKPVLCRSCTELLTRKPKSAMAVPVCVGHLGKEDGSEFGERPLQAPSLCQALGCTQTGSNRPPGSAPGGSFHWSSSGRGRGQRGLEHLGQALATGRTLGEPSKVVGQEKLSFKPQGNRVSHLDEHVIVV